MPIYEYRCSTCHQIAEFLILKREASFAPICPRCGGADLERVLSRVRVRLSEETRMEKLADPHRWGDLADVDENDPAGMARLMRRFGSQMKEALGEDDAGELDQALEEAMEGIGQEPGGQAAEPEDDL